jgi:FkbM family methyltransferase
LLKKQVKSITRGSVLHAPLRDAYRFVFNRDYRAKRRQMLSFYAQFISKGSIVFDVGANVGEYTEIFLELEADVVAVEPNPDCARTLEQIRPRRHLMVKRAALGSSQSEGTLHVCDQNTLSTLSSEWLDTAKRMPEFASKDWSQSIKVPILTLDGLIAEYGTPQFIKIDVEGYEQAVLSGLSMLPKYLSFEYHRDFAIAVIACIREKCFSADDEFNVIIDDQVDSKPLPPKLVLDEWVSGEEIVRQFETGIILGMGSYGEIFVRHRG